MRTSCIGYTSLPVFIFDECLPVLSGTENKIVVFVACQIARSGSTSVSIRFSQIAEATGLSERTLRTWLSKLKSSGFLETEYGRAARITHYRLGLGPAPAPSPRKAEAVQHEH